MSRTLLSRVTSRWAVKGAFLAFFVFTCIQLFRFVAWARGTGPYVHRPEAPAGLLPVGHFTSFFAWVRGGGWDTLLPAGLVIILGAVAVSFLFKRAFCGWLCPVGTVWELFALGGRKLMGRNIRVPRWLDLVGRAFRYVLTAAVVGILLTVPLAEAVNFRSIPYMAVADIKTLGMMVQPAYLVVVLLAGVLSMLFGAVWCRYLCPVGGMYSVLGVLSPFAVRRDEESCIHCSKCSKACHAFVDVEKAATVRDTECDGCMDCVKACPVDGCLEAKGPGGIRVAPWVWPLLVVGLWLAIYGGAKVTGNWDSTITPDSFRQVIQSGILDRASTPQGMQGQ
jgi:polyferredoxin